MAGFSAENQETTPKFNSTDTAYFTLKTLNQNDKMFMAIKMSV